MQAFCNQVGWDVNPLYAVLHESIYCQGAASNWAAQRVRDQHYAADFDAEAAARNNTPVNFTGEDLMAWDGGVLTLPLACEEAAD